MANPRSLFGRIGHQIGQLVRRDPNGEPPPADEGSPLPDPLRQDLVGGQHALAYLRHLARGNRIRRKAFFDTINDEHPPVLLIHGFLGTRGSMYILERTES